MFFIYWILGTHLLIVVLGWALFRHKRPTYLQRIALGASSALASAALFWWLFDIPGLMEFQRLAVAGDWEAAKSAHAPIFDPDPRVTFGLAAVTISALGLHMALRPEYWIRTATASRRTTAAQEGAADLSRATLWRFRVYGILIALGGALGSVAMLVWS